MIKESLFWKFNTPENKSFSVVFGTVHLNFQDKSIVDKAFHLIDGFDSVFTETSLDSSNANVLLPHMRMKELQRWQDFLSQKQLIRTRHILKKVYNVEVESLEYLRPLIVMSMVQANYLNQGAGEKLDQVIWNYALSQQKSCDGIESIYEQIAILNSIDLSYEFSQLKRWVKNISKMNRNLKQLMEYYKMQDIISLYKHSRRSLGGLRKLLLDERNLLMAQRLISFHNQKGCCFFSFGAGHLSGQNGVLSQLKSADCKVLSI